MQSIESEASPIGTPPPPAEESNQSMVKTSTPGESQEAPMVTSPQKTISKEESTANNVTTTSIITTTSSTVVGDYGIKRTIINSTKESGLPETVSSHSISVLGSEPAKHENSTPAIPMSSIPTLVGNNRGNRTSVARSLNNQQQPMQNRRSPMYGIQTIPVLSGIGHPLTNQPTSMAPSVYVTSNQPQVRKFILKSFYCIHHTLLVNKLRVSLKLQSVPLVNRLSCSF